MIIDFENGEIWIIDKPYEWTSADVVNKLKYFIGQKTGNKKFKIGHAGTLDPLATGMLLVCIGKKKTKEIDQIQAQKKEYSIGRATPVTPKNHTRQKRGCRYHRHERDNGKWRRRRELRKSRLHVRSTKRCSSQ